jgi:hypothetical protein
MSAPRRGDWVRISYEATWNGEAGHGVGKEILGYVNADGPGQYTCGVPLNATVEVLPPPEPSWANVEGAVCRFANVSIHTYVRAPFTWYPMGMDCDGYTFAEMCAKYTVPPVCLYDPSVES